MNKMPTCVFAFGREVWMPSFFGSPREKLVRHLHEDARAVAGARIGADRAAMFEIEENGDTVFDGLMGLPPLDVGDETDAARILFIRRIKKTRRYRALPITLVRWERTAFRARPFVPPRLSVRMPCPRRIFFAALAQVYARSCSLRIFRTLRFCPPVSERPFSSGRIEREIPCGIAQARVSISPAPRIPRKDRPRIASCPNSRRKWDSITVILCQNSSKHTRIAGGKTSRLLRAEGYERQKPRRRLSQKQSCCAKARPKPALIRCATEAPAANGNPRSSE